MPPEPEAPVRDRLGPLLFVTAIFASAFLIFLVQPMVGKRILPWFGGAPAVWTLCLAFYQTTLFAGYAYAHLLVRYVPPRLQIGVHALVVVGALLALPVLPGDAWKTTGAVEPSTAILTMLAANVALPFLVLAATGPLVQVWFARRYPSRSPYPLYAVSNIGSLLALLAYPFLLEPRLALSTTGNLWSFAFAATGLVVLSCALLARSGGTAARGAEAGAGAARPLPSQVALWFLLAGCAVVLLMGVTNELCLDVASVPFLWILPLGVYLISFILCFRSDRTNRRAPYVVMTAVPFLFPYVVGLWPDEGGGIAAVTSSIHVQVALFSLLLFGACMVLHGELHRLRPAAQNLTAFYLCVAGGGALGGIFVGVVAPKIFEEYHELLLGLGLGWLFLLAARWHDSRGWLRRDAPRWRWAGAFALTAILLGQWVSGALAVSENLMHQERTFFGVLRVRRVGEGNNEQRQLLNGTTLHGVQFPNRERRPTSYFGMQTGIGLALAQRPPDTPSRIGVVGLGIGTLAAYGRPRDEFRFYEIDPAVIRVARNLDYFTFLARSRAEIDIVAGDARISLASELERNPELRFDILIIDAFSSDAIPVHLLTREAVQLYLRSLKPNGLLAIHVSSQQLELMPLVARLGDDAGLNVVGIETTPIPEHLTGRSLWAFLSRDNARIHSLVRFAHKRRRELGLERDAISVRRLPPDVVARAPLWTDDYSDLFGAVRPLPLSLQFGESR